MSLRAGEGEGEGEGEGGAGRGRASTSRDELDQAHHDGAKDGHRGRRSRRRGGFRAVVDDRLNANSVLQRCDEDADGERARGRRLQELAPRAASWGQGQVGVRVKVKVRVGVGSWSGSGQGSFPPRPSFDDLGELGGGVGVAHWLMMRCWIRVAFSRCPESRKRGDSGRKS